MAKNRYVNTKIWRDEYFENLDPSEKLLFIYCITNPDTNICGVYEIPLKIIAIDTGIDKEMVIKILNRFSNDGKILYRNGWIAIKNFHKHQLDNPKVKRGIEIGMKAVPPEMIDYVYSTDSLSHLNINLNSNINPKKEAAAPTEPPAPAGCDIYNSNRKSPLTRACGLFKARSWCFQDKDACPMWDIFNGAVSRLAALGMGKTDKQYFGSLTNQVKQGMDKDAERLSKWANKMHTG